VEERRRWGETRLGERWAARESSDARELVGQRCMDMVQRQ
jgi:hypothetical protein